MSAKVAFGIDTIRRAAAKHAEETSAVTAASEIGMSRTAFRHFLKGGRPHPTTREKLVAWFVRHRAGGAGGPSTGDIEAAILLLRDFLAASPTPVARQTRLSNLVDRLSE
jgi:hypothetical protein